MPKHNFSTCIALLALATLCSAGLQVPLVIVNMAPYEATVTFTDDQRCIHHWGDNGAYGDLQSYYNSWESSDLGDYDSDYESYNDGLQTYKKVFGIPTLANNLGFMTGSNTIGPLVVGAGGSLPTTSPYTVFQAEYDNSVGSGCSSKDRWQSFTITVNGATESFTLYDPWTSHWLLKKTSDDYQEIDIGPGGAWDPFKAILEIIVVAAIVIIAAVIITFQPETAPGVSTAATSLVSSFSGSLGSVASVPSFYTIPSMLVVKKKMLRALETVGLAVSAEKRQGPPPCDYDPYSDEADFDVDNVAAYASAYSSCHLPTTTSTLIAPTAEATVLNNLYENFTYTYDSIPQDNRTACIMGRNIWFIANNYECLVAGVSLIIQANGKSMALPMPNIYRAWD